MAVFPGVVKGALLIGGTAGDGVVTVRRADGSWSPPAIIRMAGGSVGFQIGAEVTDVVLLIMTPKGLQGLLSSEFTIGADISAAAGPSGARGEVSTDLKFSTDLLTYSRTQGLFAGFSFSGASVRSRDDWNQSLYGRGYTIQEILLGTHVADPAGRAGIHPDGRRVHRPGHQQAVAGPLRLRSARAGGPGIRGRPRRFTRLPGLPRPRRGVS